MKIITLRRCLCCIILSLVGISMGFDTSIYASPAFPGLINFRQPDGTIVKIRLKGDEFLSWAESEDGYTLLHNNKGFLVYAEKDKLGKLVPTDILAADIDRRTSSVNAKLKTIGKKAMFSDAQIMKSHELRAKMLAPMAVTRAGNGTTKAPVVGIRKNLVILVDFPDRPFSKTIEDFETLMDKVHNPLVNAAQASVRDFYREASFGQLDLQSTVVGIYHMSQPLAYYGNKIGRAHV